MKNVYDSKMFFDEYQKMRSEKINANNLIEIPIMKTFLSSLEGKKILDLGCGAGDMDKYFIQKGASYVLATDISENMINIAKTVNNDDKIDYKVLKMEDLEQLQDKFDLVYSSLAFHYIEDLTKLFSDINDKLKCGGELIFSIESPINMCTCKMFKGDNRKIEKDGVFYLLFNGYNKEGKRDIFWNDTFVTKYHRTYATIINTLINTGFELKEIKDSYASEDAIKLCPKYKYQEDRPYFTFIMAVKKGDKVKQAPILDFFEEEGIINREFYMKNNKGFENLHLIDKYKIDTALFIFYKKDISEVVDVNKLEDFYNFTSGSNINKCYIYDKKFILAITPLGGSAASGLMEELGFMGIKNFFACGSAGQIDQDFNSSEFVLVEKAIRCEGTSYRYMKPSMYAETDDELTNILAEYLKEKGYGFKKSITWTTDTFFRETQSELELRKSQGAVCVEMECASWAAVAKYRGYKFAQLLYFSDAVKQENWEWKTNKHELKIMIINLMINFLLEFVK